MIAEFRSLSIIDILNYKTKGKMMMLKTFRAMPPQMRMQQIASVGALRTFYYPD